jgi:hypothetical protein
MEHGLGKKKSKDKNKTIQMKPRHVPHAHAQTVSSCRKNIVPFDEKGDNYFPYSSSTKKR